MLILVANGGLGNQLFEYSTARAAAIRLGTQLVIDLRYYNDTGPRGFKSFWLDLLGVQAKYRRYPRSAIFGAHALPVKIYRRLLEERLLNVYRERDMGFDPAVQNLKDRTLLLGNFQSYRYFDHIRKELLAELSIGRFLDEPAKPYVDLCSSEHMVSIHIRRAEYLVLPGFPMVKPELYYSRAMRYVQERGEGIKFLVVSDDLDWCRRSPLFEKDCLFAEFEDAATAPLRELALMARCRHNIISNSTYAWWGAWLNENADRMVIAPGDWIFGKRSIDLDIMPTDWVIL